jgi:hypothetical protein
MNGKQLRRLALGAASMVSWVAMAPAQEPLPPGPPPLPRIVTPDDPPPATNPAPPSNPPPATNPQSGSIPDATTNVAPPANPAPNPQPAPVVAPPAAAVTPIEGSTESPMPAIIESPDRRRIDRSRAIETDRSSFTPAISTVGRGLTVLESSYSFVDNKGEHDAHSFPELLARYGICERVELRLGFNYEAGAGSSTAAGGGGTFLNDGGLEHETNISYGVKVALTKQDGWLPQSMVVVQGFTPMSGPDPATQYIVTYGWGWQLSNCWRLDAAMRYSEDSEGGDRFNLWAPSVVLRIPVGERWTFHTEYFGEMSANRREDFSKQFISPGVHCLLTENLEVGVRVGWGMNEQSARFFSNVGVGWRF